MGGHGGLNILPQKKWNVYNYDNRAIVQKDKKLAAQKARSKRQKDRQQGLDRKLQVLRGQNGYYESEKIKQQTVQHSLITQELKNMEEKKQHVNLFQKEQQILQNRDILQYKRLKEAQFFKDKEIDFTSKFLGTYGQDKTKPWYAKSKNQSEQKSKTRRGMNGIQLDVAVGKMIYQKGDQREIESEVKRESERERSRQKHSEFYNRKSSEKIRKQAKHQEVKNIHTIKKQNSQFQKTKVEDVNQIKNIDKLRQERMKRQQRERQKAEKIKLLKMKK